MFYFRIGFPSFSIFYLLVSFSMIVSETVGSGSTSVTNLEGSTSVVALEESSFKGVDSFWDDV